MISPYIPKNETFQTGYYATWDIETDQEGNTIGVSLVFRDNEGELQTVTFETIEQFIAYIEKHSKKNKRLRKLYAHNSGGFDTLAVFEWFRANRDLSEISFIPDSQGKLISATLRLKSLRYKIQLNDSIRLFPNQSLERLAKDFKTEHQKINEDRTDMITLKTENPARFWKYVINDSIVLLEVLESFHKLIYDEIAPIDDLPLTAGSLALKIWRFHLDKPVWTQRNKRAVNFFRRSYFGGRVEAHKAGEFEVKTYDVNSMYPHVMVAYDYPVSDKGFWTHQFKTGGAYEVDYQQTNREVKPYLRDEISGEYSYEGTGVFWYWDLELLQKLGGSFRIREGFVFLEWGNLFQVQNKLYALKQKYSENGNSGGYATVKVLLNSLYGKFGQRDTGKEIIALTEDQVKEKITAGEFVKYTHVEGFFEVEKKIKVDHGFVAIASAITSRARWLLYSEYMLPAGEGLIYNDTDCVHVLKEYSERLDRMVSTKLGGIKLEKAGIGCYVAPKTYAIKSDDGKEFIRSKGVPHNVTYDDMRDLAIGNRDTLPVTFSTASTFREVLYGRKACKWYTRLRTLQVTIKNPDTPKQRDFSLLQYVG